MAVVGLPVPHTRDDAGSAAGSVRDPDGPAGARGLVVRGGGRRHRVLIFDAGLACCGVEVAAALRRLELDRTGLEHPEPEEHATAGAAGPPGEPHGLNVLVVAGTITSKLAPLVERAYRDTPQPRRVLAFGACADSGGPYWDSYCVAKGAGEIIPVDTYVPGCPPRPEALLAGLRLVLGEGGAGPAGEMGPAAARPGLAGPA